MTIEAKLFLGLISKIIFIILETQINKHEKFANNNHLPDVYC